MKVHVIRMAEMMVQGRDVQTLFSSGKDKEVDMLLW